MQSFSSKKVIATLLVAVNLADARFISHGAFLNPEGKDQEANKTKEKQMANPIDVMRGELCWGRVKLVGHSDCMNWLVEECTGHSFGTGICKRVEDRVKTKCIDEHDKEACKWAAALGIHIDTDGDGVTDDKDAFPEDPKEWKDTDGDGHGDNEDEFPEDPTQWTKTTTATTTPKPPPPSPAPAPSVVVAAPAPAPQAKAEPSPPAPGPAPATTTVAPATTARQETTPKPTEAPKSAELVTDQTEKPAPYQDPSVEDGLQAQGFSGKKVGPHEDGKTATSDWGNEYGNAKPQHKKSAATQLWQPSVATLLLAVIGMCAQ